MKVFIFPSSARMGESSSIKEACSGGRQTGHCRQMFSGGAFKSITVMMASSKIHRNPPLRPAVQ